MGETSLLLRIGSLLRTHRFTTLQNDTKSLANVLLHLFYSTDTRKYWPKTRDIRSKFLHRFLPQLWTLSVVYLVRPNVLPLYYFH